MPTYRYSNGNISQSDVRKFVDMTAVVAPVAGTPNIDITVDATSKTDLDTFMASRGFSETSVRNNTSTSLSGYSTSTASISGATFVDLTIDNYYVNLDAGLFTHTLGTAPITILTTGKYVLSYTVTISGDVLLANVSSTQFALNSGLGFNAITGTLTYAYHPALSNSNNSSSIHIEKNFTAGSIIKVQSNKVAGGSTLAFVNNSCSVYIRKVG